MIINVFFFASILIAYKYYTVVNLNNHVKSNKSLNINFNF